MSVRCVLDPNHQVSTGAYLCNGCVQDLDETLVDIVERFYKLEPQPGRAEQQRPAPGFHSTPPMSMHVGAMRDRRSRPTITVAADGRPNPDDEPRPPLATQRELGSWARTVAQDRGMRCPAGVVAELVTFLRRHLDWLSRQPWVDEFAAALRGLQGQLRTVTGDPPPEPVGYCLDLVPDGIGGQRYCRHPIFMPDDTEPRAPDEPIRTLPTLQCGACGGVYTGARIVRLKVAGTLPAQVNEVG